MLQPVTCSGCGSSLPREDAPRGACPKCLIGLAIDSVHGGAADPAPGLDPLEALGERVGPYELVDVLGEGGMGVVYLAEQTEPIRRRVALKLIKLGMNTREVLARFESERQALALMTHPHIARVHDAGATREGRPYFVMEVVPGVPITEFCDRGRLGLSERIALFVQACGAIQHAHQKGIIHRDIKPSNVLVSEEEAVASVKVIDFGVARATDRHHSEHTLFTREGALVGTPEYMSPEQAETDGRDVDTRTDVYQLGVLLYELLAGALPFDSRELRRGGLDEARKRICTQEPPRPSTRVGHLGDAADDAARNRKADPLSLRRALRGDLDWVVMKALDKDRARRYASPNELSADLERHLNHEPVTAGPPGAAYRMRKFARRHRFGVTTAASLLLLLMAFTVVLALQARRIAKERDRASREAEAASQVSRFLVDLFEVSDPGEARGNTISAREILDQGASRIERELAGQPEVQARMMATIGAVYRKLGLYEPAAPLLQKSESIFQSVLGEDHPESIRLLLEMGELRVAQGKLADAEAVLRDALARARRSLGEDHPTTLSCISDLGATLHYQGHLAEAEALYREALEKRRRVLGQDHPDTLETVNNIAATLYAQGKPADAEAVLLQALAGRRHALGPDHPETLDSVINLCSIQIALDKLAEAERACREAVDQGRRIRPDHSKTLISINNLGRLLELRGRPEDAEPYYREALEALRRTLGDAHHDTLWTMGNLGDLYTSQGRLAEAEALLRPAVDRVRKAFPREHLVTGYTLRKYGRLLTARAQYAAAEKVLLEAEQALGAAVGPDHAQTKKAIGNLVELYEAWGKPGEADRWRARL